MTIGFDVLWLCDNLAEGPQELGVGRAVEFTTVLPGNTENQLVKGK